MSVLTVLVVRLPQQRL